MDPKEVQYDSVNWIYVAHVRDNWWARVNTVMNTLFQKNDKFLKHQLAFQKQALLRGASYLM